MDQKRIVGLLFGGRSCEHEVSVISARSVLAAMNPDRYQPVLIGIDKQGFWHLGSDFEQLVSSQEVIGLGTAMDVAENGLVSLATHDTGNLVRSDPNATPAPALDVVFPVLHGTFGEDGTIQGILEMAAIPYVGCGVAASALAMDKALAKQSFAAAGILQAPSLILHFHNWNDRRTVEINPFVEHYGFPLFVKPANLGSSVGVSKVHDIRELDSCIREAFRYDNKIIMEQSMDHCQEVECAILGNHFPEASVVGEIIPGDEFYSYHTKYIDDRSRTLIPADIPRQSSEQVRELSLKAFRAIGGSGLARVDFFVHRETRAVYLNEINTLPGFTPISMYPKLWEASGIPYPALIDRLVELALERHANGNRLKRSF